MKLHVQCKLRPIKKTDIPILYELLRQSLSQRYTSAYDTKLPTYKKSEKFVLNFLKKTKSQDNQTKKEKNSTQSLKSHEFDKWYVIINKENVIMGQVFITKNNYLGYGILKKFQVRGLATQGIRLIMKRHPRKKYYVGIHHKNKKSINLARKLNFKLKGLILEKISK